MGCEHGRSRARAGLVAALMIAAGLTLAGQSQKETRPGEAADTGEHALNYVVGPGDHLKIVVWKQENVSGEYVVDGDGSFTFPLIGTVSAGGLTIAALEAELKRLLGDGFYRSPQVTVTVTEYRSKRVFLMGALRTPGTYVLTSTMSLLEALARAGSVAPDAADYLFVIRSAGAAGPVFPDAAQPTQVHRVDLRGLSDGRPSSDTLLQDGDTVFVPRAASIYVYGEVRRPGGYTIAQDTTVRQALSLAGGATEFGALNRISVLRVRDGVEREIKVKLSDRVQQGDTVVVPERFF